MYGEGLCTAKALVIGGATWSTVCVNVVLTGLIGVAGTLLGSFTTYVFQSRTAKHNREFQREREDRQEQVNSCSAFAGALAELKQRLIALWVQHQRDPRGADAQKMATECDRAGASAETARFRVQLVSGAPDLMTLADRAFDALEPIRSAAFGEEGSVRGLAELREHETSFETAVREFIQAAIAQLRSADSS
jgi:hypothetical protein